MELNRNGYGSNFNKIYIDLSTNIVKKICYNNYGIKKMKNEINFIKYITNKINFPIPKIYECLQNGYIMEYMNNYIPLYKIYNQNNLNILSTINLKLKLLHTVEKILTTK